MRTAQELYVRLKKADSDMKAEQVRNAMSPALIVAELVGIADEANTCHIDDLPRLQLRANIQFGLLKKCLPDLRSLEIKEKSTNARRLVIDLPTRDSGGDIIQDTNV